MFLQNQPCKPGGQGVAGGTLTQGGIFFFTAVRLSVSQHKFHITSRAVFPLQTIVGRLPQLATQISATGTAKTYKGLADVLSSCMMIAPECLTCANLKGILCRNCWLNSVFTISKQWRWQAHQHQPSVHDA